MSSLQRWPTTADGRQYAFAQTAGKLPLRIPTSLRRHVHRTGAIGHKPSFARPVARTFRCRVYPGSGQSSRRVKRCLIGLCRASRSFAHGLTTVTGPKRAKSGKAASLTDQLTSTDLSVRQYDNTGKCCHTAGDFLVTPHMSISTTDTQ
jgi:hypothetical protein